MSDVHSPGDLLRLARGAKHYFPFKTRYTVSAQREQTFWRAAGHRPVAGGIPLSGAGEACSKSTAGAIQFADAASGKRLRLYRLAVVSNLTGTLKVWDRLVACSGLVNNTTGLQSIDSGNGTVALPSRASGGSGVMLFAESYTATGSGSPADLTVNYINQAGNAAVGYAVLPPNWTTGQLIPVTLASGDTGVRQVISCSLASTLSAGGNWGFTLRRPVSPSLSITAGNGSHLGPIFTGLPYVSNDACLEIVASTGATATTTLHMHLALAESD